jgi:hypothetical protein
LRTYPGGASLRLVAVIDRGPAKLGRAVGILAVRPPVTVFVDAVIAALLVGNGRCTARIGSGGHPSIACVLNARIQSRVRLSRVLRKEADSIVANARRAIVVLLTQTRNGLVARGQGNGEHQQ